jgi:hypothetical protein
MDFIRQSGLEASVQVRACRRQLVFRLLSTHLFAVSSRELAFEVHLCGPIGEFWTLARIPLVGPEQHALTQLPNFGPKCTMVVDGTARSPRVLAVLASSLPYLEWHGALTSFCCRARGAPASTTAAGQ